MNGGDCEIGQQNGGGGAGSTGGNSFMDSGAVHGKHQPVNFQCSVFSQDCEISRMVREFFNSCVEKGGVVGIEKVGVFRLAKFVVVGSVITSSERLHDVRNKTRHK